MNKKVSLAPRIAFILLVLVTLGCGASSQAVSTESIKSSEAEVAVTDAPTEVPANSPDISAARIPIYDLPPGFEEIPTDDILAMPTSDDDGFQPEAVFLYVNGSEFQLIFGMNFLLVDTLDRVGFDLALGQPEKTLKEFAGAMGGEYIRDAELNKVLEGIGDTQIAMTMLADVEGTPMRVNVGMFRRDVVGGMILSMTQLGQQENISLRELGQLFDKRIQRSLEAAQ